MRTLLVAMLWALPVWALDKQGSAHGGEVGDASTDFNLSGSLMLGVAPYNPSYAARPDNTGLTLFRYGAHLDVDMLGRYLSVPLDVNMLTDRTRGGAAVLAPSEFDFIGGVTSTFAAGPGDLELGTRVETDQPVDRGRYSQTYVDARARYLFSFARAFPKLGEALLAGDVRGWATLGGFVFNPTYAARPDNTGLALLRYTLHGEVSVWHERFALVLDAAMFTDRTSAVVVRPSELDFTVDLVFRWESLEVHAAYERDMPVDRPGYVQQFIYLLAGWGFDLHAVLHPPPPARAGA